MVQDACRLIRSDDVVAVAGRDYPAETGVWN